MASGAGAFMADPVYRQNEMIRRKRTRIGAVAGAEALRRYVVLTLAVFLTTSAGFSSAAPPEGTIGVNKFDLLLQYLGTASGGRGTPAQRKVTQAMARKAIADARDAGIRYFRISAMGYAPSSYGARSDLEMWQSDREAYWKLVDRMMDDLAAADIQVIPSFVWNSLQLPALTNETVRDLLVAPSSKSYRLLDDYLTQFIERYRSHPALLFYEIGNELNLHADLDEVARCRAEKDGANCAVQGNYSTHEMIAFTRRVAARIRALDPKRSITSGHSFPRTSAQHLRRKPQFAAGGADWTPDSLEELAGYIADLHDGLDIISVHIYEAEPFSARLVSTPIELIALSSDIARQLGKRLFVGEFGGRSTGMASGTFMDSALRQIEANRVAYSAPWIWQFYQFKTFESANNAFNIEPGQSDRLITRIARINGRVYPRAVGEKDGAPPRIVVTWPLECAVVNASFPVHVTASDDSGVPPAVEVSVGSRRTSLGSKPPYAGAIEAMEPGEYEIVATATDGAGNRAGWQSWVLVGRQSRTEGRCTHCCN
jgi:hypothetical protein